MTERYLFTHPRKNGNPLTPDRLAKIAALPDVTEVRTYQSSKARMTIEGMNKGELPAVGTAVTGELSDLEPRLIAGRLPNPGAKEVVLTELVLYDLGTRGDADLENADSVRPYALSPADCAMDRR